jgi:rod shape-determining protein MreD
MLFLQRVWVEFFPLFGSGPDVMLLFLVYFALFHDPLKGVILVFSVGFAHDVLLGYLPGLHATIYTVLFGLAYQFGKNFYLRSIVFQVTAALLVTIAYSTIEFLMLSAFEIPFEVRGAIWKALPGKLILNILISPVIFRILWIIEDLSNPSLMHHGHGLGFVR